MAAHNSGFFEIPDVIHFEDYKMFAQSFASQLAKRASSREYTPNTLTLFPYPNYHPQYPNKLRVMAVASVADLALLRVDGGRLARVTDPTISDRVYSYRISSFGDAASAWTFRSSKEAWRAFTEAGISVLDDDTRPFMCRTDVTKFYPSIRFDLLEDLLLRCRCNHKIVRRLLRTLEFWRDQTGLRGLPIGPEASAVLGNLFLAPVDQSIIASGADHKRYGDDILIFTKTRALREAVVTLLDKELPMLGLTRSEEKTKLFDDPEEARENLRDSKIQYWEGAASYSPELSVWGVRRAFDQDILNSPEIKLSQYRWILKYLKNRNDMHGCYDLVCRRDLMNIDPKIAGPYVMVAKTTKRVIEECMKLISQAPEDHFEALTFHMLMAMSQVRTGGDEAKEFERIASDQSRRWPTRAAAWRALARSDKIKQSFLMQAASAESEPDIRRAIITTLRHAGGHRQRNSFLNDIRKKHPETQYTVEWVRNAA
ncbi:MAG TPA: RNA-directed DNA polymerase [Candidatus Binataceae bacterium]|nr:RNA-directed DNA polymerase [Candidatus Binataceae bacterium]